MYGGPDGATTPLPGPNPYQEGLGLMLKLVKFKTISGTEWHEYVETRSVKPQPSPKPVTPPRLPVAHDPRSCQRCGVELPPRRPGQPGANRKWCSRQCARPTRPSTPIATPEQRRQQALRTAQARWGPLATTCAGCGNPLPPLEYRGNARKWCSDACRLRTLRGPRNCRECGKLLAAERTRRDYCSEDCQRPTITKICRRCGKSFTTKRLQTAGKNNTRVTCSNACARALIAAAGRLSGGVRPVPPQPCIDCGATTTRQRSPHDRSVRCPDCALERKRARSRRNCSARRAARRANNPGQHIGLPLITIKELGDRDDWRCHLCKRKVNPKLKTPDDRSPSFDHLVPISDGGDDSPANLRLAHRGCNLQRGVGGTVQLMLFG